MSLGTPYLSMYKFGSVKGMNMTRASTTWHGHGSYGKRRDWTFINLVNF